MRSESNEVRGSYGPASRPHIAISGWPVSPSRKYGGPQTLLSEPLDQLVMQRVRTGERWRRRPFRRGHENGVTLPAAQTAVAADELFECRHLPRARIDPAVHDDVSDVRKACVPTHLGHG